MDKSYANELHSEWGMQSFNFILRALKEQGSLGKGLKPRILKNKTMHGLGQGVGFTRFETVLQCLLLGLVKRVGESP